LQTQKKQLEDVKKKKGQLEARAKIDLFIK
jgi:hypothetical protein